MKAVLDARKQTDSDKKRLAGSEMVDLFLNLCIDSVNCNLCAVLEV